MEINVVAIISIFSTVLIGIVISIIGHFLKATMEDLKSVKIMSTETKTKLAIVENNHQHLTDNFNKLYTAVKDLTSEIKHLTHELARKKDINE